MKEITEIKLIDGTFGKLIITDEVKAFKSENYNFLFIKKDGQFFRWGNPKGVDIPEKVEVKVFELYNVWKYLWEKETEDFKTFIKAVQTDGDEYYGLPEILDYEIAEVCDGVPGSGPCKFCYKNNVGHKGKNVTFEEFKTVFHKLPKTITQIAFGCGTLRKHPEMWDIFKYTKENGVTPNLTINGDVDEHEFDKIAEFAGAVAVSVYDKELSYNAIKALTDRGMKQVNIHFMISEQTYEKAIEIIDDIKTDPRLEKLNAIVFLSLKPKGRAIQNNFSKLSQEKFETLFKYALDKGVGIGFDSCSACKVQQMVEKDKEKFGYMEKFIEPCESGIYSSYISVNSEYFKCSFAEGEGEWKEGLNVANCNNFLEDIWFNEKSIKCKNETIRCRKCGISCSIYEI